MTSISSFRSISLYSSLRFSSPLISKHSLPYLISSYSHSFSSFPSPSLSFPPSSSPSSSFSSSSSSSSSSSPDVSSHSDFHPKPKTPPSSSSSPSPSPYDSVLKQIDHDVKTTPVLLYMKGTSDYPRCGFSGTTVKILKACGAKFVTRDVLADEELRSAIKLYSDWQTIPQLFVKGEFVGGCDIVTEKYRDGSLQTLLKEAKVVQN